LPNICFYVHKQSLFAWKAEYDRSKQAFSAQSTYAMNKNINIASVQVLWNL